MFEHLSFRLLLFFSTVPTMCCPLQDVFWYIHMPFLYNSLLSFGDYMHSWMSHKPTIIEREQYYSMCELYFALSFLLAQSKQLYLLCLQLLSLQLPMFKQLLHYNTTEYLLFTIVNPHLRNMLVSLPHVCILN